MIFAHVIAHVNHQPYRISDDCSLQQTERLKKEENHYAR